MRNNLHEKIVKEINCLIIIKRMVVLQIVTVYVFSRMCNNTL